MAAKLTFLEDYCQGCGLCVNACPKKILRLAPDKLNQRGFHPVEIIDQAACIACASCAIMCPDVVISIEKTTEKEAN